MSTLLSRWLITGEWRAHPWRVVLALAAIAAGVALGFGVDLVNGSAKGEFGRALASVSGTPDVEMVATSPAGFDEALYAQVAALPEVDVAAPAVQAVVRIAGTADTLEIDGVDIFAEARLNAAAQHVTEQEDGLATLLKGDVLFIHPDLMSSLHKTPGEEIDVLVADHIVTFTLGQALRSDNLHLALCDIATAQWRLNMLGRLSRISIRGRANASPQALADALRPLLPANVRLQTPADKSQQADLLSRAYRVNLDMLALMALFTGGFLVYSTQSLSVMRRRRECALLRVLGVQAREVMLLLLGEGLLLGVVGSLLGLLAGAAVASVVLRHFGGDLGGGYFAARPAALTLSPVAALGFLGLGIGAALGGSFVPARLASRLLPAATLKAADETLDPNATPPLLLPLALVAACGLSLLLPVLDGLPIWGYVAMACLLFGAIAGMPFVMRHCVAACGRVWPRRGVAVQLALWRLWAAPGQASIALCGIVASASLMVAMAVMVSSFRESVSEWVEQILPADLYLHLDGPAGSVLLDADTQARLRALKGASRVEFLVTTQLQLAANRPPVALLARDYDGDRPRALPVLSASAGDGHGRALIWVSEAIERIYGWHPGDDETLILTDTRGQSHAVAAVVRGIWRDYARQNGAIVMNAQDYQAATGDSARSDASFDVAPGADADALIAAIETALPATSRRDAHVSRPGEIRRASMAIFDRSFVITYALEAVAIIIGLAGVAATFSAQTIARIREFGMLRHLGVTRRQLLGVLGAEGLMLAAVGVIVGVSLGLLQGEILIKVVNPQSFHWTMETHLPWPTLGGVALLLTLASAGTALVAARRALSVDAVQAVREDW